MWRGGEVLYDRHSYTLTHTHTELSRCESEVDLRAEELFIFIKMNYYASPLNQRLPMTTLLPPCVAIFTTTTMPSIAGL